MKKRVLIIGAGGAGLIAVKEFASNDEVFEVVCVEELGVVGGLWNYFPLPNHSLNSASSNYSAIYKNLRTNLPRQIMNYSDMPFPSYLPSFIHHSDVKNYLWNYSKKHNLEKYIKFNTRVKSVRPGRVFGGQDGWQVEAVNVVSNKTESCYFDIVIVCNGHFSRPIYPKKMQGLDEFEGKVMHSKEYRDPEDYRDKRVVVVGAGNSGIDIASEVCQTAKETFLSHRSSKRKTVRDSIRQVGEITQFIGGRDIIVKPHGNMTGYMDSEVVNEREEKERRERICGVDVVIFCTGYNFDLAFLDANCGVCVSSEQSVEPLYKGIICLSNQSLSFIGLQHHIIPFPFFQQQAKFLKGFYEGAFKIPEYGMELLEMVRRDDKKIKAFGTDIIRHRHRMDGYHFIYLDELADIGGLEKSPLSTKVLYDIVRESRSTTLDYKDTEYELNVDGSWSSHKPTSV